MSTAAAAAKCLPAAEITSRSSPGMAPNPGGRGGGWGGGGGGGDSHGRRKVQGVRQGSEEIKKFLSFYTKSCETYCS